MQPEQAQAVLLKDDGAQPDRTFTFEAVSTSWQAAQEETVISCDNEVGAALPTGTDTDSLRGSWDEEAGVGREQPQEQEQQGHLLPAEQPHTSQQQRRSRRLQYTIADLQASWLLFALRAAHAWAFFVGSVAVAGFGIEFFLNLFLAFRSVLLKDHRTMGYEDWVTVLYILSKSFLWILILAGIEQRAVWLLMDSLRLDMFKDYRRTICLEGAGPGTFHHHKRKVKVKTEAEIKQIIDAIQDGVVRHESIKVGEMTVPRGSRLLRCEGCRQQISVADELLDLPRPVVVVFMVETELRKRSAAFDGVGVLGRLRARIDVFWQWVIYVTLDIVPLFLACLEAGWQGVFGLQWLQYLSSRMIEVSIFHMVVYFLWSTCADYFLKACAAVSMCRTFRGFTDLQEAMQNTAGAERTRIEAEAELAFGISASDLRPLCQRHEVRSQPPLLRADTTPLVTSTPVDRDWEDIDGSSRGTDNCHLWPAHDDSLNACICLRTIIHKTPLSFILICIALVGGIPLVMCITHHDDLVNVAVLSVIVFSAVSCAVCSFIRKHVESGGILSLPLWQLWFRMNFGIDQGSGILVALALIICSGCVLALWPGLEVVGIACLFAVWNLLLLVACIKCPRWQWPFVIGQSLLFATVAIATAAHVHGLENHRLEDPRGLIAKVPVGLLMFFSQLGFWRLGKSQGHTLWKNFFILVLVALAALTFLACAKPNGLGFPPPNFDFCGPDSGPDCKEGTAPLHGLSQSSYSFCSLSWDMGTNRTGQKGTVSDLCPDTALTLIDFGHLAASAGFLQGDHTDTLTMEEDKVRIFLAQHMPGWRLNHTQAADLVKGRHSSFLHVVREGTHVIAVRGTSSVAEILKDVTIWMPVGFLELTAKFGPSLYSTRDILASFAGKDSRYRRYSFHDIIAYVNGIVKTIGPGEKVYITGHSLGGGLANAVGAICDIPAVTFSSPGLQATSAILDPPPNTSKLMQRTVTVVPMHDPVARVDQQVGTALHIKCNSTKLMECHRLSSTLCEILSSCGDGGGRDLPRGYMRKCGVCPQLEKAIPTCQRHDALGL